MLTLDDKSNLELAQLRLEIKTLSRERDRVADELIGLNTSSSLAKSQLTGEINRLKLQKNKLLEQITELSSVLPELREYSKKVVGEIEGYGRTQSDRLGNLSSGVASQVTAFKEELTVKDKEFTERESFLVEFADYYSQLASILSIDAVSLGAKTADLDKRVIDVALVERKATEGFKLAQDKLGLVELTLKRAEERFKKADTLASGLEKDFDKEKGRLEKWAGELALKEKTLGAESESVKVKEKELLELKRLIEDKDKALNRKARELGIVL